MRFVIFSLMYFTHLGERNIKKKKKAVAFYVIILCPSKEWLLADTGVYMWAGMQHCLLLPCGLVSPVTEKQSRMIQ